MPEPLTSEEIRILGCLMEMQAAFPKDYPPDLSELTRSCNKQNGRFPVVEYRESQVQNGLDMLEIRGLVETVVPHGSDSDNYIQTATTAFNLTDEEAAVFCVLLLKGPRSLKEIFTDCKPLYDFRNTEDVEEALHALAIHEPALVTAEVDPTGRNESTYEHLLSGPPAKKKAAAATGGRASGEKSSLVATGLSEDLKKYFSLSMSSIRAEIRALRREVEALRRDLDR